MTINNGLLTPERRFADVPPAATVDPAHHALPATVFRFDRAGFQFAKKDAAAKESENESGRPDPVPFTMLARTGDAITHWYWGSIIHDMAGFTARKDTVCIDYCHDCEEILGFADSQVANNDGLTLSGMLTPFTDEDRASEVIYKYSIGVPYEASIDFDYSSVEYLQQNATAVVNGKTFTGPGYIVRQWTIAGSAVCPYGADGNTSTTFAAGEHETRHITLFSKTGEVLMTTETTTTTTPDATALAAAKAEWQAGLKKFSDKFGPENGLNWFNAGHSYEKALELHADALTAKHAATATELAAANQKLASIPRGETEALSGNGADANGKPAANGAPNHPLTSFIKINGKTAPAA